MCGVLQCHKVAGRAEVIEDRAGDIFAQGDLTHVVHQANLYHTFGSGIAKEIRRRFPDAFRRDCKTVSGDRGRLGTYSWSCSSQGPVIVNMYSQDGISSTHRTTHYAAMGKALMALEQEMTGGVAFKASERDALGIPYGMGCGLAGGDWDVVRPIIESVFATSPVKAVICRLKSGGEA